MNWIKKHKIKIIVAVIILAILAAAFWYGGSGSHGWGVNTPASKPETPAEQTSLNEPEPDLPPEPAAETEEPTETEPLEEPEGEAPPEPEETPAPEEPETPETPEAPEISEPSEPEKQEPENHLSEQPTEPEQPEQPDEPPEDNSEPSEPKCTITILCDTILSNMSLLNPAKTGLVPSDGVILPATEVTFFEGESVFNVLQRVCKQQGIQMEFRNTPIYNSVYIEGINNLYEFDCGDKSGWMYSVNGWYPNFGCSRYEVSGGDEIIWVYTCDLGVDVGGGYYEQHEE